jgi:lipoate-protein ligase A
MTWRFEQSGFRSGAFNMEYDQRLARALRAPDGPSIVRVYGWRPPAISLGWHQSPDEVNLQKCAEAGIDVVRRPTGGRAILHSDEVTYCVVMAAGGQGVLATYQKISEALIIGLSSIGVDAMLEKSQPHFPSLYKTPSSAACFASAARYEIHVGGRKLVGSAQRRLVGADGREVVLQHGSILLGPDHLRIVDFLNLPDEETRERMRGELHSLTTDLSRACGRQVEFDEVEEALRRGFELSWGIKFQEIRTLAAMGESEASSTEGIETSVAV